MTTAPTDTDAGIPIEEMHPEDIHDMVIGLLKALGNTADAVARTLEKLGFKGLPGHACDCPVAKYLASALAPSTVAVCTGYVSVYSPGRSVGVRDGWIPTAISDFIEAFDSGAYMGLREIS